MSVANSWGLTVSLVKTKGVRISNESSFVDSVPVCDQSVEMVKEFLYLGSIITSDGEIDADMKMRIAKAANLFVFLVLDTQSFVWSILSPECTQGQATVSSSNGLDK